MRANVSKRWGTMKCVQQEFNWPGEIAAQKPDSPPLVIETPAVQLPSPAKSADTSNPIEQGCEPPTVYEEPELTASMPAWDQMPVPKPLPNAVAAGVFGITEEGPIDPDEEEAHAITEEHARELATCLADLQAVEDGLRNGEDPRTRRVPKTEEARTKLAEFLAREEQRLKQTYGDALAAYAGGFGDDATQVLDLWVRKNVADCVRGVGRYDPGHPWHYYHAGDNAPPIPVDQIDPDPDAGRFIERDLPKNPAKRSKRLRDLLESDHRSLEEDRRRYQDIVERGPEALSRYDREIAHTSDEMARATALSLKYNHIRIGLGRIAWLETRLGLAGPAPLLPTES